MSKTLRRDPLSLLRLDGEKLWTRIFTETISLGRQGERGQSTKNVAFISRRWIKAKLTLFHARPMHPDGCVTFTFNVPVIFLIAVGRNEFRLLYNSTIGFRSPVDSNFGRNALIRLRNERTLIVNQLLFVENCNAIRRHLLTDFSKNLISTF